MKIKAGTFRSFAALILGFVFNALFYLKSPGVSIPIFISLVLIFTFAFDLPVYCSILFEEGNLSI